MRVLAPEDDPLTIDRQLAALEAQGLAIAGDEAYARYCLERLGYPRIVEYFRGFFRPPDQCPPALRGQITLGEVMLVYKFDRRLRHHCLDALESIEVALKTALRDYYCRAYPSNAEDQTVPWFERDEPYQLWRWQNGKRVPDPPDARLRDSVRSRILRLPEMQDGDGRRRRLADFDSRHIMKAVTLTDATFLYIRLPGDERRRIAERFGLDRRPFGDWLFPLFDLRNLAAHHERTWNVTFRSAKEELPRAITGQLAHPVPPHAARRFYGLALVMFHLLRRLRRATRWHSRLFQLLYATELPSSHLDVPAIMGFPERWYASPFWDGADSA